MHLNLPQTSRERPVKWHSTHNTGTTYNGAIVATKIHPTTATITCIAPTPAPAPAIAPTCSCVTRHMNQRDTHINESRTHLKFVAHPCVSRRINQSPTNTCQKSHVIFQKSPIICHKNPFISPSHSPSPSTCNSYNESRTHSRFVTHSYVRHDASAMTPATAPATALATVTATVTATHVKRTHP